MTCHFRYEKELLKQYRYIAGIDEAGRGALAGPVVVAMVILNPQEYPPGMKDSKMLSPQKRTQLAQAIKKTAIAYQVSSISNRTIDNINILQATLKGIKKCYQYIGTRPDYLLLDALIHPSINVPQKSIIKGDQTSLSIAAASIIAKTTRDKIMEQYHKTYPVYQFGDNKGYGVKTHLQAISEYGHTSIHRLSFKPVKELSNN